MYALIKSFRLQKYSCTEKGFVVFDCGIQRIQNGGFRIISTCRNGGTDNTGEEHGAAHILCFQTLSIIVIDCPRVCGNSAGEIVLLKNIHHPLFDGVSYGFFPGNDIFQIGNAQTDLIVHIAKQGMVESIFPHIDNGNTDGGQNKNA